ncbi:hypothetical protein [Candidatus Colwellia aromaticivorans]|uniref:hypothetical protein n=1 Tax=Candidatus Colwellia aromaticivorans TaxID=2267621 RepID=UPI000DF19E29|nr:hypothetical protein [Candidatus Colwellia aromaticivorans]
MTEQLPISIYVCDDLTEKWVNINSITNKLSAQFNFQAMTANWYGDEDNILFIQLLLETPQRFAIQKKKQKENQQTKQAETLKTHSDDVFSVIDDKEPQQLIFTIAITESEQNLLAQQAKLLNGLLQIKLQKVLNIIAKQLNLKPI